jgi:hypothetical protein
MTPDLEARLRAAVHAQAASVAPQHDGDSLTTIRTRVRSARRRRHTIALVGAVILVIAVMTIPRLGDNEAGLRTADQPSDRTAATTQPSTTTAPTTATTAANDVMPPPVDRDTTTTTTEAPPAATNPLGAGYQPLWPFPTENDARAWQETYRTSGQQPWHLDADQTALSFTTGFLGFTEIDNVISHDIGNTDAYVTVGYTAEGQASTAAVIHLRRFGADDDAPWEVVGTADQELTLETPDYGTTARSPVTVGGTITGVDESLRIQVRQASSSEVLGESCCLPAGGTHSPWQAVVAFTGASNPALTIVVSTGGHIQDVERFAITGVRP